MMTIDFGFCNEMWTWHLQEISDWFERCQDPDQLLYVLPEIRPMSRDEESKLACRFGRIQTVHAVMFNGYDRSLSVVEKDTREELWRRNPYQVLLKCPGITRGSI